MSRTLPGGALGALLAQLQFCGDSGPVTTYLLPRMSTQLEMFQPAHYDRFRYEPVPGAPVSEDLLQDAVRGGYVTVAAPDLRTIPAAVAQVAAVRGTPANAIWTLTLTPSWAATCCDGTGLADYAAVPCPNPRCPMRATSRPH